MKKTIKIPAKSTDLKQERIHEECLDLLIRHAYNECFKSKKPIGKLNIDYTYGDNPDSYEMTINWEYLAI